MYHGSSLLRGYNEQGSPEKQNQYTVCVCVCVCVCVLRGGGLGRDMETEIYFKGLAYMTVGTGQFKSYRVGRPAG